MPMTESQSHSSHPGSAAKSVIPGPAGLPVLGSMLDLRRDSLGTFLNARRAHGDVVRLEAGPPGLRSVFHAVFAPEGVQQILASQATNFRKDHPLYEEVRQAFGNGLLTSQDTDYLRQRRLVQPLFTKRRVDSYAAAVTTEADTLVDRWRTADAHTVDLIPEMNRLALRTVARILFGLDAGAAEDAFHRCAPVINAYVVRRAYVPVKVPRDWPTPGNRRARAATDELNALCDRIIADRRAAGSTAGEAADEGDDLLSLLAAAGNDEDGSLDATEVREQVLIFLLAGHETTATSLAFTLHLLARHPAEQARVREEIDRVLGDRTPTPADLDRLPYLTQALKESMRLYPAAPVVSRMGRGGHGDRRIPYPGQAPMWSSRPGSPTATRTCGRTRNASIRSASHPSGRPGGTATRGSRSAAVRGPASGSISRCWSPYWRWPWCSVRTNSTPWTRRCRSPPASPSRRPARPASACARATGRGVGTGGAAPTARPKTQTQRK